MSQHTLYTNNGEGKSLQRFQNYFFVIPGVFSLIALIALGLWGLKPGIDLAGGSLLEVAYPNGRPEIAAVHEKVKTLNFGEVRIQPSGDKNIVLREHALNQAEKTKLEDALKTFGTIEERQFTSVGPSIGAELIRKAWWAIGLVTIAIILFIAFAFRNISKPVLSWKYGVIVIVTLLHDILIPTGVFAYLGHVRDAEVGTLFIVALLTILGISINDTIVVFDRIRENITRNDKLGTREPFGNLVWRSNVQTMARSINTSVTVLIMLIALAVWGPESTKDFSITLIIGMIAGTYSSIFFASPLLVLVEKYQKKDK